MTTSARVLELTSPILEALDRELEPDSRGPRHGVPPRIWSRALGAPLRDFLGRPGKEFRGELTKIFFRVGGRKDPPPTNLPLVVEALHAGSLVVDDIEDESMERRGLPTLHRVHGVPVALNAGNWMYFWASALLDEIDMPSDRRARAGTLMTRALLDCHYGQALDLSVRVSELAQGEVAGVVRTATALKTGSLVGFAAGLGALVGGASDEIVVASDRFGRDLGAALQMLDDLSGVASPRRAHKGLEDVVHDRPSWPWAWLASSLPPAEFEGLRGLGRDVADGTADPATLVVALRERLVPHARRRVHEHLEAAHSRLAVALPPGAGGPGGPGGATLSTLRREIERLEKSYV